MIIMMLKGKIAVVTGSSRGIGRAIAAKLAEEGCKVVINYNEDKKGAEETQKIVGKNNSIVVQADVSKSEDCKKLVESAIREFDGISILVNNAGVVLTKTLQETSEKDWDESMNINLKGAFLLSKYASHYMKNGSIINISSIRAFRSRKTLAAYTASKAGLIGLTKNLAIDLADKGIRVNSIAPGAIETEGINKIPKNIREEFKRHALLKRLGKPEEIANVAAFLASDGASYITGATIIVDGGVLCQQT